MPQSLPIKIDVFVESEEYDAACRAPHEQRHDASLKAEQIRLEFSAGPGSDNVECLSLIGQLEVA